VNNVNLNDGFVLGEWRVEPLSGVFIRGEHSVHVEPKVMEVLICLAQSAGQTVTRDQLLNDVWQGVVVSEEVLTRAISELRSLLGDTAREKRYVRTLPKRGYSLIMPLSPVSVSEVNFQQQVAAAVDHEALQASGDRLVQEPVQSTSEAPAQNFDSDLDTDVTKPSAAPSDNQPLPWPVMLTQQFMHMLQTMVKTLGKVALFTVLIGAGVIIFGILMRDDAKVVISAGDADTRKIVDTVMQRINDKLEPTDAPTPPLPPAAVDTESRVKTIAVLPFVDLSAQADQAYFADGVSEDIRNALIGSKDLRVVARTSSRVFKDQVLDIREIGQQLNAEVLVEGTVRLQGQQVRVTVQLTDTESGFPIWAGSFDRSMDNAFAIQQEIAREVASKLESSLSTDKVTAVDSRAYEKYLLGRHYWHQRTPESLAAARNEFNEAIAIQPDYALAYSGLADGYSLGVIYEDLDHNQALVDAQRYVDRALELDPRLAEAHASQGIILELKNEIKPSRRAYERAVQLKPAYSMARMWLGNILMIEGELNQAYEQYRAALDNDPLHPSIQSNYLSALQMLGRFDEALALGDQFYNQSKSGALLKQSLNALVNAGRYDEVLDFVSSHNFPAKSKSHIEQDIIDSLIRLGQIERARELLAQRRGDLKAWQLAILDMELALVTQDFTAIDGIAARVEQIDPADMWAKKALCDNYDKANVARADYWRGLKSYAMEDYQQAEQFFEVANANGGGCWSEPDIELSLMLYRADVAGLLNKPEKRQALLHNIEQRITKMRAKGWAHLPIQVSELVYFILTDQSQQLRRNLERMGRENIQPMGIAVVDPLLSRHLSYRDTAALFAPTVARFVDMQKRGSEKQLAKFGL
tara:strand:+ start:152 stop:2749 length:2598 start_codon:yes stop_codon:yes gene_type:complete